MSGFHTLVAYFTPETVLPVASIFAAVMGFGLLVVRAPFRAVLIGIRRFWNWVNKRSQK